MISFVTFSNCFEEYQKEILIDSAIRHDISYPIGNHYNPKRHREKIMKASDD